MDRNKNKRKNNKSCQPGQPNFFSWWKWFRSLKIPKFGSNFMCILKSHYPFNIKIPPSLPSLTLPSPFLRFVLRLLRRAREWEERVVRQPRLHLLWFSLLSVPLFTSCKFLDLYFTICFFILLTAVNTGFDWDILSVVMFLVEFNSLSRLFHLRNFDFLN